MPDNIPVPHPLLLEVEPHRRSTSRWRLRLAAALEYVRRWLLGRAPAAAAQKDERPRMRSLAEWRRLAAALWVDEGNLRVVLVRARLRGDARTEVSVRRSIRNVVARAQRTLTDLVKAQRRGDVDRSASRPAEALLRSVVLAWETPPDELLAVQVVDRYRVPVVVDGGDVLPIDELDASASDRRRR